MEIPVWHKELLTVTEAAAIFNIGEKRLKTLALEDEEGKLVLRIGVKLLFKKDPLKEYLLREYSL